MVCSNLPWYEYAIDVGNGCEILNTVWARLGCMGFPFYGHQTDDAVRWLNYIHLYGQNRKNQLHCKKSCWKIAAAIDDYGAFDDKVWWITGYEDGSIDFVVRGYRDRSSQPETLAVVLAQGKPNHMRHYWVNVPQGYAYYDVVERDWRGWRSPTERFMVGEKPNDWEEWIANPDRQSVPPVSPENDEPWILYELVGDELIPVETSYPEEEGQFSNLVPPRPPPDTTGCTDVVIYSSLSGYHLIAPVAQHCRREGLKVRSFVGTTSDPMLAKQSYNVVVEANTDYWDECHIGGGHCTRQFPLSPLLILVGDVGSRIIDHATFGHYTYPIGEDCDRCGTCPCHSDFDITDINSDGKPEGPVTRIPARYLADVEIAVKSAEEFNRGVNVDPGRHLMLMAGDAYDDWNAWPASEELLTEVAQGYQSLCFNTLPMLVASHFENGSQRVEAAREQINGGVLEMWGFGLVTSCKAWPGGFITRGDDFRSSLTTKQSLIAWVPGCETVAEWDIGKCYNQASIVQKLMFNDSTKTTLAACVGHLSGAYDFQHEEFARIILEERLNAEPGMTVAEVVWRAVREAQKIPWLANYARSVWVMGGYVKLPAPTYASISEGSLPKQSSCEISLSILPNPARAISGLDVEVSASRGVPASLAIYDVRGRLVDRIHSGMIREGRNVFKWRMTDSRGGRISAGIYFVRLSHPGGAVSRKIVVGE